MQFRATIEIRGINPYVFVSTERAATLKRGWRKPMPVRVQINDQPDPPWRINMMPAGDGGFLLYLHGHVRKAAGCNVGDVVDVHVAFDDRYRPGPAHPMPKQFADALGRLPAARTSWENLTPSLQKEFLRYFAGLKSDEAWKRNLERALHVLSGGDAPFLGRPWTEGRPTTSRSKVRAKQT
jgi:predicted dehydrogenase